VKKSFPVLAFCWYWVSDIAQQLYKSGVKQYILPPWQLGMLLFPRKSVKWSWNQERSISRNKNKSYFEPTNHLLVFSCGELTTV